jgi:chaperonin cofactor prefoldin
MKGKVVRESIEFDFRKPPPHKRYQSISTGPGPKIPNPRKKSYSGLLPDEEEQIEKYEEKIATLQMKIDDLEDQKEAVEMEIKALTDDPYTPDELDDFYGYIIETHGEKVMDILNSGMPDEEKVQEIDQITPAADTGIRDIEDLVQEYNYHHPGEPDPYEIDLLEKKIGIINNAIKDIEKEIDKHETKIYNISTY